MLDGIQMMYYKPIGKLFSAESLDFSKLDSLRLRELNCPGGKSCCGDGGNLIEAKTYTPPNKLFDPRSGCRALAGTVPALDEPRDGSRANLSVDLDVELCN